MKLIEFKKIYFELQKKHSLPSFDDMNSSFDIGRIRRDSGNILRDVRRTMIEKIIYYIKLVEVMINPSQASPVFLMLLKEINSDDKKVIDSVLNSFVELEIISHKLDVVSKDSEEGKLINQTYSVWDKKSEDVMHLINILERNLLKTNLPNKKSRDYFN